MPSPAASAPRPGVPLPQDAPVAGEVESGLVVGTSTETTAGVESDTYKTEFVKVYQDAGVVGAAMLTLLVLCCLLGLFCSRLIKMYTALTESRDTLEAARTVAIEKLTTSLVLLRSETNSVIAELRREHEHQTITLAQLTAASSSAADKAQRAYDILERVHDVARTAPDMTRNNLEKLERLMMEIVDARAGRAP